jgi:hypothetical protein
MWYSLHIETHTPEGILKMFCYFLSEFKKFGTVGHVLVEIPPSKIKNESV